MLPQGGATHGQALGGCEVGEQNLASHTALDQPGDSLLPSGDDFLHRNRAFEGRYY